MPQPKPLNSLQKLRQKHIKDLAKKEQQKEQMLAEVPRM